MLIFNFFDGMNIFFQEQAQNAKKQAAVTPDEQEDLSPLPSYGQQPPSSRRRGAISAEPVSEEDATSYVKKVSTFFSFFATLTPPFYQ